MKIMLIEDDDKKRVAIVKYLYAQNVSPEDIILAKNMTDFAANLNADIGLFIIDIKIPSIDNGLASQNGPAIMEALVKSGKNDAFLLAISSYPEDFPGLRASFEKYGCILADFRDTKSWQSTLDHLLIQLKKNIKFDFLVFCALQEERNPYITLFQSGKGAIRGNIDCFDIQIAGQKGSVILLPKMGLVNAAVTAAVCIDRYKPSVVAMSGICGGFKSRAHLGQLLISEMVYEYQSGKWSTDGFLQEPYQVPTAQTTITSLAALANKKDLLAQLEAGFRGTRPTQQHAPAVGVFTSGSAVIADKKFLSQVEQIHRKVNALDMEVFAIQRAAQLATENPPCICAKTVVDLCDNTKDNKIHSYGSYISAKFVTLAIADFFSVPRAST